MYSTPASAAPFSLTARTLRALLFRMQKPTSHEDLLFRNAPPAARKLMKSSRKRAREVKRKEWWATHKLEYDKAQRTIVGKERKAP